jgi:hypothetical protein
MAEASNWNFEETREGCGSMDDSAAYGHLYQWGRAADGHESRTSATTRTLASNNGGSQQLEF